jgi:aspartate dehydrogenase
MLKVGIIGAGTMGSIIARSVSRGEVEARIVGLADLDDARAKALAEALEGDVQIGTIGEIAPNADLLVEAAGADAVEQVLREAASRAKDVIVLSVGALIELEELIQFASDRGSAIYCPSGAIAGLDAIKAASIGKIESARLTTRKPPAGLSGAPHLHDLGIDLSSLDEPMTVFEGSARDACKAFPANINVSAALSLAGIGVDRTHVRLIADPTIERNIHEIEVTGDFGVIRTVTENTPSDNPKTSRLAALSAVALLKNLTRSLRVGT